MGLLDRWRKKKITEQLEQVQVEDKNVKKQVVKDAEAKNKIAKKIKIDEKSKTETKVVFSEVGYRVLLRPLITEKAAVMESLNKYTFAVHRLANKFQIKQAIQEVYGVAPIAVQVINAPGKNVRFGKNKGRRSDYKKAIVTLPAGKSISIHEGV